jgi:hypothetical protein
VDSKGLLTRLKQGTLDPDRVEDPEQRAIVEFAQWLAFPTELGVYPDEIEILDRRALYWPPAREEKVLYLLRYRVHDTSGFEPDNVDVGLVGSTTFCLFSSANHQRPLEDVYALHCYYECYWAKLLSDAKQFSGQQVEAAVRASGIPVANAEPVLKVLFAKRWRRKLLDYPADEVLLVSGEHAGAPGWLVCDGPRSTWFPASEMPDDALSETALQVHVGRVLLGFETAGIQRRKFLTTEPALSDQDFLERYRRALSVARGGNQEAREEAFDSFGAIARHAKRYVSLLNEAGRTGEVKAFIDELRPYWDHNTGYSQLGMLAFESNLFDLSKQFIEKLRESYKDHHRSETMGMLARIYAREGRLEQGVALLRDCVARIQADEMCSPREVEHFSAPLLVALRELETVNR